jgi:hypothetical protein
MTNVDSLYEHCDVHWLLCDIIQKVTEVRSTLVFCTPLWHEENIYLSHYNNFHRKCSFLNQQLSFDAARFQQFTALSNDVNEDSSVLGLEHGSWRSAELWDRIICTRLAYARSILFIEQPVLFSLSFSFYKHLSFSSFLFSPVAHFHSNDEGRTVPPPPAPTMLPRWSFSSIISTYWDWKPEIQDSIQLIQMS